MNDNLPTTIITVLVEREREREIYIYKVEAKAGIICLNGAKHKE